MSVNIYGMASSLTAGVSSRVTAVSWYEHSPLYILLLTIGKYTKLLSSMKESLKYSRYRFLELIGYRPKIPVF